MKKYFLTLLLVISGIWVFAQRKDKEEPTG
jgi:hypothetical protein